MELMSIDQVLQLNRNALAASGPAVAVIKARAVAPTPGTWPGLIVRLDGEAPQDRTPPCSRDADPLCAGDPVFNNYSVEVVQRIGYDSFTPDSGVLIVKNKDRQTNSCGYGCHAWAIDARPDDIDKVDYVKPAGERVMRTMADYRQLNDALFHAGLRSGSQFEWTDEANRLHFYVIDRLIDTQGVLSYVIGVRSLDGAGPQARGVRAEAPASATAASNGPSYSVTITNSGAAAGSVTGHPAAPAVTFASDIYRVSVSIDGAGWEGDVQNALVGVEAGRSARVPVFVRRASGNGKSARVTVTVVSESDPTKRAVSVTAIRP
jgi:hypothetical protein